MRIEHIGYQVSDPAAVAGWYVEHFGFVIKRSADAPVPVRFLADSSGQVILEIYNNPKVPVPDYASMDPLTLHIAFVCEDVPGSVKRCLAAGATTVTEAETLDNGDELAMLRDPWGLCIQMAKRGSPLL